MEVKTEMNRKTKKEASIMKTSQKRVQKSNCQMLWKKNITMTTMSPISSQEVKKRLILTRSIWI
jgi:hypothetical protein